MPGRLGDAGEEVDQEPALGSRFLAHQLGD
jgi:hypothetical protein